MEYTGWIGKPWPELNEGILYSDTVKYPPSSPGINARPVVDRIAAIVAADCSCGLEFMT